MNPKYRAWLKAEKQMIDVDFLDLSHKVLIGKHWEFGMTEAIKFDDVILMQSTGIKDKNSVEIFEGEVVRVLNSLYTVFYDSEKGSFRLKPHDERWHTDYMSNFSHGGNFEVIGNMYEGVNDDNN